MAGSQHWIVLKDGPCFLGWAFRSCRLQALQQLSWQTGSIRCRSAAGKAKALTLDLSPSPSSIRPSQAKSYLPLNRPSHLATFVYPTGNPSRSRLHTLLLEFIHLSFTAPQPSRCLQISGKQVSADDTSSFVAIPGSFNHQRHRPRLPPSILISSSSASSS